MLTAQLGGGNSGIAAETFANSVAANLHGKLAASCA